MVIFHCYVSSPEGNPHDFGKFQMSKTRPHGTIRLLRWISRAPMERAKATTLSAAVAGKFPCERSRVDWKRIHQWINGGFLKWSNHHQTSPITTNHYHHHNSLHHSFPLARNLIWFSLSSCWEAMRRNLIMSRKAFPSITTPLHSIKRGTHTHTQCQKSHEIQSSMEDPINQYKSRKLLQLPSRFFWYI